MTLPVCQCGCSASVTKAGFLSPRAKIPQLHRTLLCETLTCETQFHETQLHGTQLHETQLHGTQLYETHTPLRFLRHFIENALLVVKFQIE